MIRILKKLLLGLTVFAIGCTIVMMALYTFTPLVDHAILRIINRYTGNDLRISYDNLSGNILGTVRLDGLRIMTPADTLKVERLEVSYSLINVIRGRYFFNKINLERPMMLWHLDDTAAADSGALPLDSLIAGFHLNDYPTINIGSLTINDGAVRLLSETRTDDIAEINAQLRAELSPSRLYVAPLFLRGYWQNRDLRLNQLSFLMDGDDQTISLADLCFNLNGISLYGNGQGTLKPEVSWTFALDSLKTTLEQLYNTGANIPYQKGKLMLTGEALGTLERVDGALSASGQLDQVRVDQLATRFTYGAGELSLDDFGLRSSIGSLSGRLDLSQDQINAVGVRFSALNLQPLAVTDVPTRLNGRIDAQLSGTGLADLDGHGELSLFDLAYDDMHIDAIDLNFSADRGNLAFEAPSRITIAPGAAFQFSGTMDRNQTIDIAVVTDRNSIDSLSQRLALAPVGGSGSAELQLSGALSDPAMSGYIYLDSLTYEQTIIYGIDGDVDIKNIMTTRLGRFDLELATGYIEDIFLTSGVAQFQFDGNRIAFDPFQFYSEENSIVSAGVLEINDEQLALSLSELQLAYERYAIRNQDSLQLRLINQDSLVIDRFSMTSADSGTIDARGYLDLSGEKHSALLVQLEKIRLAPFNEYLHWKRQMQGLVNAELDLYGRLNNPEVDLTVNIEDFTIDENQLGRATGDFTIADRRLSLNVISFEGKNDFYFDINGNVDVYLGEEVADPNMEIASDIPMMLNVVFGNLRLEDYDFLYDTNVPVEGAITGRLDIEGSWQQPFSTLTLSGSRIKYADYEFPGLTLEALMQPDNLVIKKANINFLNTEIQVQGEKRLRWNPANFDSLFADKYTELYLNITEDSLNFLGAINPQLERLIGKFEMNAVLKGDYDSLEVQTLDAEISKGKLYLATIENSIDNLNAKAYLDGSLLRIDRLTAKSPKPKRTRNFLQRWFGSVKSWFYTETERGDISGSGWVDLADLNRPRVNFALSADHAYFNYFIENTQVVVDAPALQITGRDTILVSGEVSVVEGDVEFDFVESEKNLLFQTSVREEPPFVVYNLDIDIPQNFTIRSYETLNSFEMDIDGNLRVLSQPRSMLEMSGALNTSGTYFVQGESFQIQNGKIEFINPKELPELKLTARTFKRDAIRDQQLTFLLNVTGKIDAPEKDIVILDAQGNVLQYDVKDQLALLLFGVTFDQLSGSDAQKLILSRGEQLLTQVLISSIEREARTFTGLDQIRLDQQDSFFSSRLNRPSTLSLGKYLTTNLYLEYRSRLAQSGLGNVPAPQLSWEAGNQIYLQYRLNRNWSFSSIYQKTLEGNNKVQFDINWQVSF